MGITFFDIDKAFSEIENKKSTACDSATFATFEIVEYTKKTLRPDLKCRRCFEWIPQSTFKNAKGICHRTQEVKSHIDYCMDYHDTMGGIYAYS